ncbi:hypothetical protein E2C01_072468 [Portunus trituberculatus]|uniref:Uncharacterized protein n=1 Tax=Portunus trituberculatus TaxID=210409 RepID=A0A5B7I911_PORTR|nr:hypothetical protein [Portunus trituberculatus]
MAGNLMSTFHQAQNPLCDQTDEGDKEEEEEEKEEEEEEEEEVGRRENTMVRRKDNKLFTVKQSFLVFLV